MHDLIYFYPQGHAAHYESGHPERPERIEALVQALEDAGWWQSYPHLEPIELTRAQIEQVHSRSYLELLETLSARGAHLDTDTYTTPSSWELALKAAGGSVAVARAVWLGAARRGFSLARPPGHHATRQRGMGFCLINNIAVAADDLLNRSASEAAGGHAAERLAIVDLDLHHGNGTQEIFWRRKDVLFISTHQSPLYPGSGALYETGAGDGLGFTANFPLPPMTGNDGFTEVMEDLILPLLDRHAPQMLLVSFGFDTHWRDPLGSLNLSAGCYRDLIGKLAGWADRNCGGKIALFLEGGYDLDAGKACVQAAVSALLGRPWDDPLGPSPIADDTAWRGMFRSAKYLWQLTAV